MIILLIAYISLAGFKFGKADLNELLDSCG